MRILICLFLSVAIASAAEPVQVTVVSTLATGGENIRALAFDGDAKTYFLSDNNAAKDDSFTLTFDKPVTLKSMKVLTSKPDGTLALAKGELEASSSRRSPTVLRRRSRSRRRWRCGYALHRPRRRRSPSASSPSTAIRRC
jgi:hypothetical protein